MHAFPLKWLLLRPPECERGPDPPAAPAENESVGGGGGTADVLLDCAPHPQALGPSLFCYRTENFQSIRNILCERVPIYRCNLMLVPFPGVSSLLVLMFDCSSHVGGVCVEGGMLWVVCAHVCPLPAV